MPHTQSARTPAAGLPEHGAAGLRTVFRIFDELGITADEGRVLLGGLARTTYYRWRKHPEQASIHQDLLERLSYLLGIYKAIAILVPDERQQAAFLRRANSHPVCGGRTPLEVMLGGQVADLYRVRRWLDGERGW
jgi:hypothetical protein